MADQDPFSAPVHLLPPGARRIVGEQIWRLRKRNQWWSCELRDHGRLGVEAQFLRNGVLTIGRLFPTRELAVQWADAQIARFQKTRRALSILRLTPRPGVS